MEKTLIHGHRTKKEGMTLVEAIVAIAIVVIVSGASASLAYYSSNMVRNQSVKRFFNHEIDSIGKLYLTYGETHFPKAMNDYCGVSQGYSDTTYYYNDAFERTGTESSHAYRLVLDFDTDSLTLSSYYQDGGSIYGRSLTK